LTNSTLNSVQFISLVQI